MADLSGEKWDALLKKRAAALAARKTNSVTRARGIPCFFFSLGPEKYAVELPCLEATAVPERVTPVPGTHHAALSGVFNWRGSILSLIDLAPLLGLVRPPRADDGGPLSLKRDTALVLILKDQKRKLGMRVDFAEGVREIPSDEFNGGAVRTNLPLKFVKALTRNGIILLDARKLLEEALGLKS